MKNFGVTRPSVPTNTLSHYSASPKLLLVVKMHQNLQIWTS